LIDCYPNYAYTDCSLLYTYCATLGL